MNYKDLLIEARKLILAMGESDIVPIQFRQHGWLAQVNKIIPADENDFDPIYNYFPKLRFKKCSYCKGRKYKHLCSNCDGKGYI